MKNNKIALVSLIIAIVSFLALIFIPVSIAIIGCSICLILSIIAIITGFVAKKQIKANNEGGNGKALAGIILGFVGFAFAGFSLFGFIAMSDITFSDASYCPNEKLVKDCVDNNDGTSTCLYNGLIEIPCTTEKLKDSQFKK